MESEAFEAMHDFRMRELRLMHVPVGIAFLRFEKQVEECRKRHDFFVLSIRLRFARRNSEPVWKG